MMKTVYGRKRCAWGLLVMVLILCFVAMLLGPLSLLIPPLLGYGLFVTLRRRSWLAFVVLIVMNPLAVYFIGGMLEYAKGAPVHHFVGLPSIQSFNVDPETRCSRYGGGCRPSLNEWVFDEPHDLALRLLCSAYGPPSRSYDGPYPTKEEAQRLTSAEPEIDVLKFRKGKITVGGETLEMDPEQIRVIAQDLGFFCLWEDNPDPSEIKVQAVLLENRCLIVRFVETISNTNDFITLFDRKNMRPFAYYPIKGDSATRFPKIQYLPAHSR